MSPNKKKFSIICVHNLLSLVLFVDQVAEIEYRIKKGYYIGHGLSSVKEDISRMCRDAIK